MNWKDRTSPTKINQSTLYGAAWDAVHNFVPEGMLLPLGEITLNLDPNIPNQREALAHMDSLCSGMILQALGHEANWSHIKSFSGPVYGLWTSFGFPKETAYKIRKLPTAIEQAVKSVLPVEKGIARAG